jgi:hypothetical protein
MIPNSKYEFEAEGLTLYHSSLYLLKMKSSNQAKVLNKSRFFRILKVVSFVYFLCARATFFVLYIYFFLLIKKKNS